MSCNENTGKEERETNVGLDQRITFMRGVEDYVSNKGLVVEEEIWLRKVNALHGYFERVYGTENTVEHSFSTEDVDKLVEYTEYILRNRTDIDYIMEKLPPTEGFFFGSYEIDDNYFADIEEINDVMSRIQTSKNVQELYYYSWY